MISNTGKVDFIYLNEDDMLRAGVADMRRCIDTMEETFRLLDCGDYRMGGSNANEHGVKVFFPDESEIEGMPLNEPDKRYMAMPAYLGGKFHSFAIKCYGSNQHNSEKNLPRSILMVTLMDVDTGAPLAYMSANILSAMRTGATVGLGAKYLANKTVKTVAVIGPGVMGRYGFDSFMVCRPMIETVKIKGRGKSNIDSFIAYCKEKYPHIKKYVVSATEEEACQDADIVYYSTTNAARFEDNPLVKKSWLKPGAVVISASALLADTDFLSGSDCKLVADNYAMYEDWGRGQKIPTQRNVSTLLGMGYFDAVQENKIKRENIVDIGKVISGELPGRDNLNQIILYAVGGMPIEDVAWARECYDMAQRNGIGMKLNLWEQSKL